MYSLTGVFFKIFSQPKFQFYSYGKREAVSITQRLLKRCTEVLRFSDMRLCS